MSIPKVLWEELVLRREGLSTFLMGMAAVVTTWCAFESTKWGGRQAIWFNQAAAARVESSKNQITENQNLQVDIATFIAWLQALQMERGPQQMQQGGPYRPDPATLSGFLYARFRKEFRPVVEAWVATRPAINEDAPPTPFVMDAYRRPLMELAVEQQGRAEERASAAREANRISDDYMLTTVIAALATFVAGLSPKLARPFNALALLGLAWIALIVCLVVLWRMPVIVF